MSQQGKTLSGYWKTIQGSLFPFLEEELGPLTQKQFQLITILEVVRVEDFLCTGHCWMGRPPSSRKAIARAFIAKCVYNLNTTRDLHERLHSDKSLRRICGWEQPNKIPSESTFSRAFEEFSASALPQRAHEALIRNAYQGEIVGHICRDSTAIESREKPEKPQASEVKVKRKKKRGRPQKGEERPVKEKTRIQKQLTMSFEEMIQDLPTHCNKGAKKNSKGYIETWNGYKLHIDTGDGGVPISAILTSASLHDSQAAIPLATMTARRVDNFYDLMDSAYYVEDIMKYSRKLNHVPLVDIHPRRNEELKENLEAEKKARRILLWKPPEAIRYNIRTTAERTNARLKDEFGGNTLRVRGSTKVFCHLMIGILVIAADQLMRLVL